MKPLSVMWSSGESFGIGTSAPSSFSDDFSATATPIGSPWVKNCTVCQVVVTTGGNATNNTTNTNNDDAYAWVNTSAFQAPNDDYEVTVTMAEPGPDAMETEVLVRVTDNSSDYFAYELLINGGGYEIVRIDGGPGGRFTEFNGSGGTPNTVGSFPSSLVAGDKARFRVTGTNPVRLQAWYALAATPTTFVSIIDVNDSNALRRQTGQPGIGFYTAVGGGSTPGDKAWADFSVVAV